MKQQPREAFNERIRGLEELARELNDHSQKQAFLAVANVFFYFYRAFQQQNPEPICKTEFIFNSEHWPRMKAEALRVAQSVDPTLTMDIFPEDTCRLFIPFCRILMSKGSDEEVVRQMSAFGIVKLQQEGAPDWVLKKMHDITQSKTSVPEKNQAAERLLHKMLRTPCAKCDELKEKMPLCGGCRKVRYCSQECQRADWSVHKLICKK